jgi:hypothetical protein
METPVRDRRVSDLPANLDVERARLPVTYVAAKHALAECERLDVCKEWADKAQALASYARQANDTELQKMAMRIQARAIRRCGELLKEIEPQQGGDRKSMGRDGPIGRIQVATEAGLSERQRKTALRVANVPPDEFNAAVDAEKPSTVTQLANGGTQRRTPVNHLGGRDPEDYSHATHLIGVIEDLNREAREIDLEAATRGLWPDESRALIENLKVALRWLSQINTSIGGDHGI